MLKIVILNNEDTTGNQALNSEAWECEGTPSLISNHCKECKLLYPNMRMGTYINQFKFNKIAHLPHSLFFWGVWDVAHMGKFKTQDLGNTHRFSRESNETVSSGVTSALVFHDTRIPENGKIQRYHVLMMRTHRHLRCHFVEKLLQNCLPCKSTYWSQGPVSMSDAHFTNITYCWGEDFTF